MTTFLVHCPSRGECSSPHHVVDEAMARGALDDTLVVDLVQNEASARVVDQLICNLVWLCSAHHATSADDLPR